ncbi:MAG: HIRAN domain-containing protein [Bacteroidetes bacterium]|nr:HIRAN domain-containing protein [Bacteroidota bacterium]
MSDNINTSLIKSSPGLLKLLHQNNTTLDVFRREMLALSCLVAGTSHQHLQESEPEMIYHTVFDLKREPKNEFDDKAVAIYFRDNKIGYIPQEKNEVIANLMDAGKKFSAKLISKEWKGDWLKIVVEIFLND